MCQDLETTYEFKQGVPDKKGFKYLENHMKEIFAKQMKKLSKLNASELILM